MARKFRRKRNRKLKRFRNKLPYNNGRFKVRAVYPVRTQTIGGQVGAVAININTQSFGRFFNLPLSSIVLNGVQTNCIKTLYDHYVVEGIKLKWIPGLNNASAIAGGATIGAVPSMAVAYDTDNLGQPPNFQMMIQRDYATIYSPLDQWERYFKIKYVEQEQEQPHPMGYHNLQDEVLNGNGVIWIKTDTSFRDGAGTGLADDSLVGHLMATVYMKVKGRTSLSQLGSSIDPLDFSEGVGNTGPISELI